MEDKNVKTIEHPLEEVFDITPGSTQVPAVIDENKSMVAIQHEDYDPKDKEIEDQFQEVYNSAMNAFEIQSDIIEEVEGKYAARNAEVAVQFLNAALSAINGKKDLKQAKDKIKLKTDTKNPAGGATINNNFYGDTNDLLREILKQKDEKEAKTIEGEKE